MEFIKLIDAQQTQGTYAYRIQRRSYTEPALLPGLIKYVGYTT
jgi:hypothetical protein